MIYLYTYFVVSTQLFTFKPIAPRCSFFWEQAMFWHSQNGRHGSYACPAGPRLPPTKLSTNMARPKKNAEELRTKSVNVSLTVAEYEYLKKLAGHGESVVRDTSKRPMPTRARSIAGIIQGLLFDSPSRAGGLSDEDRKALFQLAGMARNLNQLAAQANAQGYVSVALSTDRLAGDIRELINSLRHYDR